MLALEYPFVCIYLYFSCIIYKILILLDLNCYNYEINSKTNVKINNYSNRNSKSNIISYNNSSSNKPSILDPPSWFRNWGSHDPPDDFDDFGFILGAKIFL